MSEITNKFTYTVSKNGTAKITAYISNDCEVVIPGNIEGYPVVAFNKDVFKNNKEITYVAWPVEIPIIPKEIFFGCSSLKEIVIPEGVTEISEKAFRNCESLSNVTIPASVTVIHEKAFECAKNTAYGWEYWNCIKTIVGDSASFASEFAKNTGVKFLSFDCSDEEREVMNLYSFHEVDDGISLDDFVITDDMPRNNPMYGNPYLIKLEIPNEILGKPVVELSRDFHKSKKQRDSFNVLYDEIAETLIIPQNLKRIRCPLELRGIQNVMVSSDNSDIVFDDYAWYEDGGETVVSAWHDHNGHNGINEYSIKEGTVRTCADVEGRFKLKKLFVPDSLLEVHPNFLSTSSIKKIYANETSRIKESAAENYIDFISTDHQDVVFSEDGNTLVNYPQSLSEEVYSVPNGVKVISQYAFKGNDQIREIILSDSVEKIEEGAFAECTALENIILTDKITELSDMLFAYCKNLTSINLPSTITKIGNRCFEGTALKEIIIPEGVLEIGDYAFNAYAIFGKANAIDSIELPKSVRKIGRGVCADIKDITIYDSIDPGAKPAKVFYDDVNGICNSMVGYIGIHQHHVGVCNSNIYKHTITVKSAKDSSIKYKVLMYGKEEARDVYCAMTSSWGKNAEFNFAVIDEKFSKLKDVDNRLSTVLNRLKYPIDLSDEEKEKYLEWIKRNTTRIATKLIENSDIVGLQNYEKYNVITKNNIQKLIELAENKNNVDLVTYLLEQKSKL